MIELSGYTVKKQGFALKRFDFAISPGECWFVSADYRDNAELFFAALATLVYPVEGNYRFKGTLLDFSSYKNLLPYKKRMGYISPCLNPVSNRTIRENLLLPRYCEENSLSIRLDKKIEDMCVLFHIRSKLEEKITMVSQWDAKITIMIRELSKSPELILVERPEEVVAPDRLWMFTNLLHQELVSGRSLVIFSRNKAFYDNFSPDGKVMLKGEKVTII